MRIDLPGPRSASWVLTEAAASAVFSLLSMLVIGRIIGPDETGIGAVAVAAFLVADILGAALFPDALVQRPALPVRMLRTALTASVLIATVVALLLAGAAPLLALGAEQGPLTALILALAPLLPLSAFSGTASGVAMREQRFRMLAMRVLVCQPAALGAGLAVAHAGFGAWAMVVNQAVATVSVFVLFLAVGRLPLRPALDITALRELWPVAGPQLGALVVTVGRYRLFLLAVGLLVTEAALAQAHFAFRMLDAVLMMVWQAVSRLGMPRLCALQGDLPAMARCFGQLAQLQALLGLPCSIGIALVAKDLVQALLGPDWAGTAQAAQVAGLAAAVTFISGNHFSLFVALGKARLNFYVAAAQMAVPMLALAVLQPHTPAGVAWAWASASLVVTPPVTWLVLRELDRPLSWLVRQVLPAVMATAAMVAAVLLVQAVLGAAPALLRCVAAAVAGGAVFGAATMLLLGWRLPDALRPPQEPPERNEKSAPVRNEPALPG